MRKLERFEQLLAVQSSGHTIGLLGLGKQTVVGDEAEGPS